MQKMVRGALLLLLAPAAPATFAADEAPGGAWPQKYVSGSWVNVRAAPAAESEVIDHVIVNTPVRVTNDAAGKGYCGVRYAEAEQEKTGYLACRLIGEQPLQIAEVGAEYRDQQPNPDYSAPRAFWLDPGVERLRAAGLHFEKTMLKPEERAAERPQSEESGATSEPPRLRRFPIPEYEAMKARLEKGVMGKRQSVANYLEKVFVPWSEVLAAGRAAAGRRQQGIDSVADDVFGGNWSPSAVRLDVVEAIELPAVTASFFSSGEGLLHPSANTEMVSALLGIPYRAKVKSGPKWIPAGHYSDGYLFGAWDVGAVETRLISPVKSISLYRDGRTVAKASEVPGGVFSDPDADGGGCHIGYSFGDAGTALRRAVAGGGPVPALRDEKVMSFYSLQDLPGKKAKVVKTRQPMSVAHFIRAETLSYDLDHDGVADIFLWEGTGRSNQEIHDPGTPQAYYRLVLFNIAGEWRLFIVDEFNYGCGC